MNQRYFTAMSLCTLLTVAGVSHPAAAVSPTDSETFSGTVNLEFTGSSNYVEYEFGTFTSYDPSSPPVATNEETFYASNGNMQSYNFTVSGLTPDTTYHEGVWLNGCVIESGDTDGCSSYGYTNYNGPGELNGDINSGNVAFTTDGSTSSEVGQFEFQATDPVNVAGTYSEVPAVAPAPELDSSGATVPAAILLATTALLADRRRRKNQGK